MQDYSLCRETTGLIDNTHTAPICQETVESESFRVSAINIRLETASSSMPASAKSDDTLN